jgi:hypothetical protein
MEFEFGANWARFSRLSGGVIGQPLAMEGVFSFFLESAFLGLFLYGEKRISKWMHWFSAVMVFAGSWISGFFIIVTDAWMQHPVAYDRLPNGQFEVLSFWQLLLNPWGLLQYGIGLAHSRRQLRQRLNAAVRTNVLKLPSCILDSYSPHIAANTKHRDLPEADRFIVGHAENIELGEVRTQDPSALVEALERDDQHQHSLHHQPAECVFQEQALHAVVAN